MRFAEFHQGQRFTLGPVTMTQDDIIAFASAWDPQWFHIDPARAANSRWNGLIASGWHTCSVAMRLVVEGPLADSDSIGSPGLAYLRWKAPVRPGDVLMLDLDVLETGRSGSGRAGSVRWAWTLRNQNAVIVMETEATSLFELKAAAG